MSLIFADSFDHYAFASRFLKWDSGSSQGDSFSAGNGRWGTTCWNATHGNDSLIKSVPALATYIVGGAWYCTGWGQNNRLFGFYHAGILHLYLSIDVSGKLTVYRGDGTVLGAAAAPLANNAYHYIEMKATINNTTGAFEVRVNGVAVIGPLSSQDTQNGGSALIESIKFGHTVNTGINTMRLDDVYICDTAGGVNDDFLGDVRVEATYPNGNGNTSALVGSDGNSTDNYLLVDETTPSTADYVESSTPGDKDTYAYGNLTSAAGAVKGVQILPYAAKTDAGTRSIASVARLSGTEVDSADKALSASYLYLPDIRQTKPGGGAWTVADVNAAEFGVKVTA